MLRTLYILAFSILSFQTILFAQKTNEGVYLTANDFKNGKISFQKIEGKKYQFHTDEVFSPTTIKIVIGDSTIVLHKSSIFGYKDQDNNDYRYFKNEAYRIINPLENILLYSLTSLGGYKGRQIMTAYFFSTDAYSPLFHLTLWNVKSAFKNNLSFQELIELYFHDNDEALLNYDSFHKIYKINHVYQISKQLNIK